MRGARSARKEEINGKSGERESELDAVGSIGRALRCLCQNEPRWKCEQLEFRLGHSNLHEEVEPIDVYARFDDEWLRRLLRRRWCIRWWRRLPSQHIDASDADGLVVHADDHARQSARPEPFERVLHGAGPAAARCRLDHRVESHRAITQVASQSAHEYSEAGARTETQ